MLTHFTLPVERGRLAVNGIGFQKHLANIVERTPGGIAHAVKLIDFGEFGQHVSDVLAHLRVAQTKTVVKVLADQLDEELL